MIAERTECLDKATLVKLLSGKLPSDRFSSALAHVDSCEHCSKVADGSLLSNSLGGIGGLAGVSETSQDAMEQEPECQAFVADLLLHRAGEGPRYPSLSPDQNASLPCGTLGPYKLLRTIGVGGMGAVYLAEHQRLRRTVAIKLLPREKVDRDGWLDRFNREMTAIAALEHANVVRALDAGEENDWHYLVMEHLDGLDVSRVARRCGEVSVAAACEVIRQAALGLEAIHQAGLVHRDIKPSNLFLTTTGEVKILDLGLVIGDQSPLVSDGRLTTVGHLMGTLPYMPREQLDDARTADARSDIYSLGATLFRLLAGRAPYGSGENLAQTISAITNSSPPSIAEIIADLPAELCSLIDRMLSPDPASRPTSAQAVADAVADYSDMDAAKSMIRAAMLEPERCDAEVTGATAFPRLPDLPSSPPSRHWKWLAAAGVPLAFLAGIILMVQTDRGTLVIESDQPSVSVRVTQGEKTIDTLRVESGKENSIRLRSGRYSVEIVADSTDAFEISGENVTLMRGDEQVVRITRRPEANRSADLKVALRDSPVVHSWPAGNALGFRQSHRSTPFAAGWLPQKDTSLGRIDEFGITVEQARGLSPVYDGAAFEPIDEANVAEILGFTTTSPTGFLFAHKSGRVLRWFGDVDRNGELDHRMYFSHGSPTWCELDTDLDGRPDVYLIFENGRLVSRGDDDDGDGIADTWSGDPPPSLGQLNIELTQAEYLERWHVGPTNQLVRRFENQPLSYWLRILETDRDMATLSKAMQAVGLLAESPDEQLQAAEHMLRPARQLGGLILGGRGGGTAANGFAHVQTDADLSSWFMSELAIWYPRTFPHAGLQAIASELETGTLESKQACLLLLSNAVDSSNARGVYYPPTVAFYESVAATKVGRKQLEKLDSSLQRAADDLTSLAKAEENEFTQPATVYRLSNNIAQENRAAIATALHRELRGDKAIVAWANEVAQPRAGSLSSVWISPDVASHVARTLEGQEYSLSAVAPALIRGATSAATAARSLESLEELAEERGADLAEALLGDMAATATSGGSGFGAPFQPIFQNVTDNATAEGIALSALQSSTPDPINVLTTITTLKIRAPQAFTGSISEAAIDGLLVRALVETDGSDPQAYARLVYAARGIAMRESLRAEDAEAVFSAIVDAKSPGRSFRNFTNAVNPWPDACDSDFTDEKREGFWDQVGLYYYTSRVFSLHPALAVDFAIDRLRDGNCPTDLFYGIPHVGTGVRAAVAKGKNSWLQRWVDFADTPAGVEKFAEFETALLEAIDRERTRWGETPDQSSRNLAPLDTWLQIASLEGNRIFPSAVVDSIQSLTEKELCRFDFSILGVLALGRTQGYAAVTPEVLNEKMIHDVGGHLSQRELTELVDGVYATSPVGFVSIFKPDGFLESRALRDAFRRVDAKDTIVSLAEVITVKLLSGDPATRNKSLASLAAIAQAEDLDWDAAKQRLKQRHSVLANIEL